MASDLDRFLESIDPSRTFDQVSQRADQAVNSFVTEKATIQDWEEFKNFFAEFYRNIEKAVLRLGPGAPDDKEFYWGRCMKLLNEAFGPSGFKAAFEIVRTGKEGGLYRVLKAVSDLLVEQYAQNEISARISHYWNGLTVEEQIAATDEYLREYEHLLPSELTQGSAVRIKANFPKVLKEHPKMIRRMRRIGR